MTLKAIISNQLIRRLSVYRLRIAFFIIALCVSAAILANNIAAAAPTITFKNRVRFNDMLPGDIFSNNSDAQSFDEGLFEPEVSWDGTSNETGLQTADLDQVYTTLAFTRWSNDSQSNKAWLWRYRQTKNEQPDMPSISLSYSIEDDYGNSGRLSHRSDPTSWIAATVIDEEFVDESNNKRWLFKGSVRLSFNISNAFLSGNYDGILYTTLTYL